MEHYKISIGHGIEGETFCSIFWIQVLYKSLSLQMYLFFFEFLK
jgi:hypothetical protein